MVRMKSPVRSVLCKHFQCFDSSTGLVVNCNRTTWRCIICSIDTVITNYFIDGYTRYTCSCSFVLDILTKAQTADEVIVDTGTGEWHCPSDRDATLPIGILQYTDRTFDDFTEGVDEETLVGRVTKACTRGD